MLRTLLVLSLAGTAAAPPDAGEPLVMGSLDKGVIRAVISSNRAQIRSCYEKQLVVTPKVEGRVVVRFTITKAGDVESPKILESSLNLAAMEECIAAEVKTWSFPKPKGGGVVIVTYPFAFSQARDGGQPEAVDTDAPVSSGDSQVTGGLSKDEIHAVMKRNTAQIRDCYQRQLVESPTLEGRLLVKFQITAAGSVAGVKVVSSTAPALDRCVVGRVSSWRFPEPKGGGTVTVVYPFNFERVRPDAI
ncbi:MAG: TonB family protein [Archangiaceae bacterium]|nr:TonB family protein [Archangiaceae bacterium]